VKERLDLAGLDLPVALLRQRQRRRLVVRREYLPHVFTEHGALMVASTSKKTPSLTASGSEAKA